jgi:adenylate cyclase
VGNQARINVSLVDGDSGHIVWAQSYDVGIDDIFTAQEESATNIAAAVQPRLESAELRRIVVKRTEKLNAWDHFLHGISYLNRFTRETNALARAHFEQAIQLDSNYSDAYTGLSDSLLFDILLREREAGMEILERDKSLARAFEAARKAITLDTDSSSAHRTLGHAYVWAEEIDSAITETEQAVELNPSNADARRALGNRLDLIGRTSEGITQMEWALQLNPCDPRRWIQIGFLTRAHLDARHYDEALSWAQRAVWLRPDQSDVQFRLAVCLSHVGRRTETSAAIAECERLRPGVVAEKISWKPYSDPARNEHFFAGLRTMGVI